jgi:hypothetical protein
MAPKSTPENSSSTEASSSFTRKAINSVVFASMLATSNTQAVEENHIE